MAEEVKTRKREKPDGYGKARQEHRAAADRHVLVLETTLKEDDKRRTFNLAERLRKASNTVTGVMKKRLDQLTRTKAYKQLKEEYKKQKTALEAIEDKKSPQYKKQEAKCHAVGQQMNKMQKAFKVTQSEVTRLMAEQAKTLNFHSVFGLSCAEDIWQGIETVLYRGGKTLHFKKRFDFPEIRAKQPNRAIICKREQNQLVFSMDGVSPFGVIVKKNDQFAKSELEHILAFMADPSAEQAYVEEFIKTGIPQDTFRICYCSLVCETIRDKLRVFIHITVEGRALPKVDKNGNPRHKFGKGNVGADVGAQSIAVVSDNELILKNLAERDGKSTFRSERAERLLNRKMDRSRRANNPERFNADGTYKRGVKGKWKTSHIYRKTRKQLANIRRKNADSRLYAAREDANYIRSLGDVLITEARNAKSMQKKAKRGTTIDKKTGRKKEKRRKRHGRSIQNRCPGRMHAELVKKFQAAGGTVIIVPMMFRASQYDHKLDDYIKKKLRQRWHIFEDGSKVQRDLYSAFLMYCINNDLDSPNRELCFKYFDDFLDKHEALIQKIIASGKTVCNSGIKVAA